MVTSTMDSILVHGYAKYIEPIIEAYKLEKVVYWTHFTNLDCCREFFESIEIVGLFTSKPIILNNPTLAN